MADYVVGISVGPWSPPGPGKAAPISGTTITRTMSGVHVPSVAGLVIAIAVRNNATGVSTGSSTMTDASGNFSYTIPGSWHPAPGSYAINVFMIGERTIGGNVYYPFNEGYYFSYPVTAIVYETVTTLLLFKGGDSTKPLATVVHPGDPLFLEVAVAIHNPGGANDDYLVASVPVNVTLDIPGRLPVSSFVVNTGSSGITFYNLTGHLSAATALNFGDWVLNGSFSGEARSGEYYNPSDSATSAMVTAVPECVEDAVRCQGETSQICQNNSWMAGGNACSAPPVSNDKLLMIGAAAGLAVVGAVLIFGLKKGKRQGG